MLTYRAFLVSEEEHVFQEMRWAFFRRLRSPMCDGQPVGTRSAICSEELYTADWSGRVRSCHASSEGLCVSVRVPTTTHPHRNTPFGAYHCCHTNVTYSSY